MSASHLRSVPPLSAGENSPDAATFSARVQVASHLRNLSPYEAVSSLNRIALSPDTVPHKLDWNEATIPPSPKVADAIASHFSAPNHLNWYPDLTANRLTSKLEGYVGFTKDHILVTNGSDDALSLICSTFLNHNEDVVAPIPTYAHFLVFAQAQGANIVAVESDNPFEVDVDLLISKITPNTKIVYLAHPNNPTGAVYTQDQLRSILKASKQALVVVDEAYYEFYGESALPLLHEFDNLIVTRTFSKCFGLAGLRIGYAVGRPWVLGELKRIFNPKSVNTLGQIAAEAALSDLEYYQKYVVEVNASKIMMKTFMEKWNIPFYNTPANFVMFQIKEYKRVQALLEADGVYIRSRTSFKSLGPVLRMSVGTTAQTQDLLNRLESVLLATGYTS